MSAQKRFSLEGGDALIPLLDDVVQRGGAAGVEEIVIGMAHRGRLNVLVNVLGKSPSMLFSEFEGKLEHDASKGSGDVKYHKGFSADLRTAGGNVHVVLAFNPSHLEVVNAGRRRLGARAPGAARRRDGRHDSPAPDPWRCGVCRAGRRHGDDAAVAGARLRDGRHAARHHQQPGRLHDQRSARMPVRRSIAATSPR